MRLHPHLTAALLLSTAAAAQGRPPPLTPPGEPESTMTRALEAGSTLLQRDAPWDQLDVYVVGFHPMAENPLMQFEAHRILPPGEPGLRQCALYDGNPKDRELTGIEYIISERLFPSCLKTRSSTGTRTMARSSRASS